MEKLKDIVDKRMEKIFAKLEEIQRIYYFLFGFLFIKIITQTFTITKLKDSVNLLSVVPSRISGNNPSGSAVEVYVYMRSVYFVI